MKSDVAPPVALVTADGYVSESRAPHAAVAADMETLQQFTQFLELRLLTENVALLRRMMADFLLDHERTVLEFVDLAATLIVIKPFSQRRVRRRIKAATLLDAPKRELDTRRCVFEYLADRLPTRNMALLKRIFQEFLQHEETLLRTFVDKGDEVISVLPWMLPRSLSNVPEPDPTQPPAQPTQEQGEIPTTALSSSPNNDNQPKETTSTATTTVSEPATVKVEGKPAAPDRDAASNVPTTTAGNQRPPTVMRKRGRPPKRARFRVHNVGPRPTPVSEKRGPSDDFKTETVATSGPQPRKRGRPRRGSEKPYELPPRAAGKRQVKSPGNFAAEQAVDAMAPKRRRRNEADGETDEPGEPGEEDHATANRPPL